MAANRVAIITGGTGGLGQPVTLRFLADGGACAVPYGSTAGAEALQAATGADAGRLLCVKTDILVDVERDAFIARTVERFGGIDCLVHLVGGFAGGTPVAETDPATLDRMLDLNLRSFFLMARVVIPHLKARGGGAILSVAARAALHGTAGLGAYAASKAALLSLTQTIAEELRDEAIRANCVLPSIIDTPANRAAMPDADHSRWVAPEEIAGVLAFLASPESRVVSGAAVPVYGRS